MNISCMAQVSFCAMDEMLRVVRRLGTYGGEGYDKGGVVRAHAHIRILGNDLFDS